LLVDGAVQATHGRRAMESLRGAGYEVVEVVLEATERAKTPASAQRAWQALVAGAIERRSPVVTIGGGIVGDIGGFVAATFLRGLPSILVPTTLLAMVDASIGGKTGVNLELAPGTLGKNLVGAFWQPRLVLADPQVLRTLDDRHWRCGLAECVKHALI